MTSAAETQEPRADYGGASHAERGGASRPGGAQLIAVYVAYLAAVAFGRWMVVIPEVPIAVWPPNGVILAMLLTQPRKSWGWWVGLGALGELTGNALWYHNPLVWALGYVVANAAAVVAAAWVLRALTKAPMRRFVSLRQVLAFLGIGVLAAPVISATLGSAVEMAAGKNPFTTTWPVWWLGDATGILIATPLIISAANAWRERAWPSPAQALEGGAIAVVLTGLSLWVLSAGATFAFLLPVPILWAALRFEFRGAALAVLVLTLAIGVHAQNFHRVPLSPAEIALLHMKLQALVLVGASTGLIVAAIIRQQRQALSELSRINDDLEARVAERTRAIEAAEQRFKATFENAGVGIGIVGGDGALVQVNDSLAQMLGRTAEEMEGHPLEVFTHPDDLAKGKAAWAQLASGQADDYDLEKRYLRKDGQTVWGHTTVSCVRRPDGRIDYLIKVIQNITERKRSETVRHMLMREVNHRSKNLLSVVQVIARQTATHSPQDFIKTFGERLRALAANQDILVNNEWQRVDLAELVRAQLGHFGTAGPRVRLSGPPVMVPPAAAQALGMALHELATNAAKYGSLSNQGGHVDISWTTGEDGFRMSWRETGGPPVTPPQRSGFGSMILDQLTASSMSGEVSLSYAPDGVVWELRCPMSTLHDGAGTEAQS
ncbi:MASE1 domain-containing protein [Limimaricola sp. ASW11-118]|uniref:histidine kinase n=1 Tax=Limimaricola litoreus TaxID=2955316 RepID=A0A9X2FWJ0_9RHOB|nr:MASE1 domain-containing protein [Limimaricola litoreus]MCP1168438.1 MASE1 domain-containing protein [Limimaricola litoreus]